MIGAARLLQQLMPRHVRTSVGQEQWAKLSGVAAGATVLVLGVSYVSSDRDSTKYQTRHWGDTGQPLSAAATLITHDNAAVWLPFCWISPTRTHCEEYDEHPTEELSEGEAFLEQLLLYRRWLKELKKQWDISSPSSTKWPNNIPSSAEISALETDLQMYIKGGQETTKLGQDLRFRIASYYLFRTDMEGEQRKGFLILKQLALEGHNDGMCLYGMVYSHGGVAGIEANPKLAVKYWRRSADDGHLASMYELAVALYMGDGTVEDPALAVKYFVKAADLGHLGAAYMLAECYLDGVGVPRHRVKALEWLVTAAELGHQQAQQRLEMLIVRGGEAADNGEPAPTTEDEDEHEELIRWWENANDAGWRRNVSLERRFTIGGGSRNPLIFFRRKSVVAESRRTGAKDRD